MTNGRRSRRTAACSSWIRSSAAHKAGILAAQREFARVDSLVAEVTSWYPRGMTALEVGRTGAAVAATQGRLRRADAVLDTAQGRLAEPIVPQPVRQIALQVAAIRARLAVEVSGDRSRAGSILRDALASIRIDSLPPLNVPALDIAQAFAALDAAAEAQAWLAQADSARPVEAIHRELDYEVARGTLLLRERRAAEALPVLRQAGAQNHCERCVAMQLAEAFDAVGQPDSAITHYRVFIEKPGALRIHTDQFYLARAHFRLAELLELKGDRDGARRNYAAFIDLWKDADPELQPRVRAAQDRLRALGGPG